jgi:hypothetical protein
VSVAMGLSLAHALEFPGKLRLSKDAYMAAQAMYYPGFTWGGFVGEGGGMLALIALALLARFGSAHFWCVAAALLLLVASHATYWIVTHPVNGFWLKDTALGGLGAAFFAAPPGGKADWTQLRDVWEWSHVARAGFSTASHVAVAVSLTLNRA